MKTKTKIIFASLLTTIFVFAEDTNIYKTGLPVPTEKERLWFKDNCQEITGVRLNKIAVARIQEEQKAAGLKTVSDADLSQVEIGDEFVTLSQNNTPRPLATPLKRGLNSKFKKFLPSSADNSSLKYFPPIRSQGSIGSCAAKPI